MEIHAYPPDHEGDAHLDRRLYQVPEEKPVPVQEPELSNDLMSGSELVPGSPEWFAELKRKLDLKKK